MFSKIQDSIDINLTILVDNSNGFYNISAAARQYNKMNSVDKKFAHWKENAKTKELIAATKEEYELDLVVKEIVNISNDFKGTYVHPALYRAFLMWLNVRYALKIFAVIEKHQQEHTAKLKYELDHEKTKSKSLEDTLSQLMTKVDSIVDSNARLEKSNKKLESKAEQAEFNLSGVKQSLGRKLDTVANMLKEKSLCSTRNPTRSKLHHNFVVMGYKFVDIETGLAGWMLSFIAGQESHVTATIAKKYNDQIHDWTVQIGMHYNANPIDLRNNIQERVKTSIRSLVDEINTKRIADANTFNKVLRTEIDEYNVGNPKTKRSFVREKAKPVKVKTADITVKCGKASARYLANEYLDYEKLLQIITGVNIETQASPYVEEVEEKLIDENISTSADNSSDGDYTDVKRATKSCIEYMPNSFFGFDSIHKNNSYGIHRLIQIAFLEMPRYIFIQYYHNNSIFYVVII